MVRIGPGLVENHRERTILWNNLRIHSHKPRITLELMRRGVLIGPNDSGPLVNGDLGWREGETFHRDGRLTANCQRARHNS